MRIVRATGTIKNGEIKVKVPQDLSDGEVDVIVVAKNELDEFEAMRKIARDKGYDSKEKILEIVKQVRQEMLVQKGRSK